MCFMSYMARKHQKYVKLVKSTEHAEGNFDASQAIMGVDDLTYVD